MKCELFQVVGNGDVICDENAVIGNARRPPAGLSLDQFDQVAKWIAVQALAEAVAPIFTVVSSAPDLIEVAVRLRAAARDFRVTKRLDHSLNDLKQDMRDVGVDARLSRSTIAEPKGEKFVIWELSVFMDPTAVPTSAISRPLQALAEVLHETRLGEHVMNPADPWVPEQLGRRRRRR